MAPAWIHRPCQNPSLTYMALTARACDYAVRELKKGNILKSLYDERKKLLVYPYILGAVGVFIPYTILTIIFDYPDILREDAGVILTRFYEGGASLILVWFLFAILGLPLILAYVSIGQKLENKFYFIRWATTLRSDIGYCSNHRVVKVRHCVVPMLANSFVTAVSDATKESNKVGFQTIHQFGGVLLGEHLGQLFTIAWTIMITIAFNKLRLFPKWIIWLWIYFFSNLFISTSSIV